VDVKAVTSNSSKGGTEMQSLLIYENNSLLYSIKLKMVTL
jgi:hypothetical protein